MKQSDLNKAQAHLKKDEVLKKIIERVGDINSSQNQDLYFSLLKAIVSQQLSIKAADTIWQRFLALFKNEYPHAQVLLKMKDNKLRAVGLSSQKAGYIKNIARFSVENTLEYQKLKTKSDAELIDYLVQIKGVGRWTVEMVLIFSLNREDVFPIDDLGIQNGIKHLYELDLEKKELLKKLESIAENWRPHRTLACRYIWRYKDENK